MNKLSTFSYFLNAILICTLSSYLINKNEPLHTSDKSDTRKTIDKSNVSLLENINYTVNNHSTSDKSDLVFIDNREQRIELWKEARVYSTLSSFESSKENQMAFTSIKTGGIPKSRIKARRR